MSGRPEEIYDMEIAQFKHLRAQYELAPHYLYGAAIIREGSRWCCTLPCHSDPMQCVTAYGETPLQACKNFDTLWTMDPPEVEDELEQF